MSTTTSANTTPASNGGNTGANDNNNTTTSNNTGQSSALLNNSNNSNTTTNNGSIGGQNNTSSSASGPPPSSTHHPPTSTITSKSIGPPPIPPTKPILSSPGAYKHNYVNSTNINLSSSGTLTAGIHSVNKAHLPPGTGEKPAIAARPIPPPTLPKYSSSFGKIDRERNDFAKLDRAEREKEGIGGSYRLASLDRLANRQRLLEQNGGMGNVSLEKNGIGGINNYESTNGHSAKQIMSSTNLSTTINNTTSATVMLQSKREMFFKSDSHSSPSGPPPTPPTLNNHVNSNSTSQNSSINNTPSAVNDKHHHISNNIQNNHHNINTSSSTLNSSSSLISQEQQHSKISSNSTTTTTINSTTATSVGGVGVGGGGGGVQSNVTALANNINNLSLKEKQQQLLMNNDSYSDSNKIASERYDKEKVQAITRPKPKELDGYVGFANLPNQVYRKAVKKGFEFTLMVVGESGLGKSTLINSMFLSDIYNQDQHPGPSLRIKKTVAVESTRVLLKENGVNLTLTVVDTPGFGDAVDNSNCWVPIIDFVESKYEEYLTAESRVHRKATPDNRVHSCLYFIAPSGHGLKPLDVEFMQRLCDKVNIIPVIAKADTMTPEEVQLFKKQILNEIAQHKIKIYDFPEPLEDEEEAKALRQLRSRVPFAVVGANTVIEVEGKKIRGRRYPWGIAEVENLDHCDFIALRNMVIRTHLQDLKDVTNNVHYENYRCRKLAGLGADGKARLTNKNPLAQMEEEKREHDLKMKKMEAEMEQVFEMKVKEKKQKLKDSELELTRRHEERKKALEIQIRELEERRRGFDQEKKDWEESNHITLDELRRRSLEANSKETASMTSRGSDESKGRRVFGSLLRRHTSFGAPDAHLHRGGGNTPAIPSAGINSTNSLPPN
ncbi:protein peanut isoform X2 [Episyrphus balteatus]|uniref:protein peanut isoform X2 n=1 Tax=Episyrphus balteatus TaxID=286459 RepID=UPI002485FA89|nr:protein peanut isoform X2 [Episyrphus balteatus]